MKTKITILLLLGLAFGYSQDAKPTYIGSKKCKMCHNKAEKGAQYTKWTTTAHAKSFDALLTEKALAIAKERGLKTTPDQAGECLECHVTGWGDPSGYQLSVDPADKKAVSKNKALKSVSCEVCHGAGSLYKGKTAMNQIKDGVIQGADVGLLEVSEATCQGCHNDRSPTNKEFNYEERLAKIAHPYPSE